MSLKQFIFIRKRYKWEVGKEHHTQPANLPKTTEKNDNEQFIVKI